MNELEFEAKVNSILKDKFNDNSLFVNNDFDKFYKNLLDSLKILNIDELINNDFKHDINKYYKFYNSLYNSYLLAFSFYRGLNLNVDTLVNNILSLHEEVDDYVINEIDKLVHLENKGFVDDILEIHRNMVNTLFNSKFDNFIKIINDSVINIINDKKYLINNIDNIYFIDYLNRDSCLTNMDIDLLNLYFKNKKYDILPYVSDNIFFMLSIDQIKELLSTFSINARFIRNLSSGKIKYILSLFDIKDIVNMVYKDDRDVFFEELNYLSEDDLNYLISNHKLNGIEKCKYVLNNNDYVKKIFKSDYQKIFSYLSINQIDDEILDNIEFNLVMSKIFFNLKDSNISNLLKDNKIFLKFSQNMHDSDKQYYMLEALGKDNITREKVLFCMLDGMMESFSYISYSKECFKKVKEYYNRSLDDIKYALECGYKCSSSTIQLTEDEIKLFIDYNQPEIIYYCDVSFDIFKYATLKGIKIDNDFIELISRFGNFNDILADLIRYNIYNNNLTFCDSIIISFATKIGKNSDLVMDLYKDDLAIIQFLNFSKINQYNIKPKNKEEIYEYFNENGPSNKLYERALIDKYLYGILRKNDNFINCFKNDVPILNYIKFMNVSFKWLDFKSKNEIYEYFNSLGPSNKFYNLALTDENYFHIFYNKYNLLGHFQNDSVIISYLNYRKKVNTKLSMILKNKEDIYTYFNELGPNKKFYDYVFFENKSILYNVIIYKDLDNIKMIYDESYLNYFNMIYKYGRIFDFINKDNVHKYFNESGVTKDFTNYFKDNKEYTKKLLDTIAHDNIVLNNLDISFVNIFKLYILDEYFSNINNCEEKYEYLLSNLGPNMLFNLDNDNVLKLINLDDSTLHNFMNILKCCKYDVVPNNVVYNNIIISLCNFAFKKECDYVVNIFTNIKNILVSMSDSELEEFYNNKFTNHLQWQLDGIFKNIIRETNYNKEDFIIAIKDFKNLNEDSLYTICRVYLENCEVKYLMEHKDIILNTFGIDLVYDRDDTFKKISSYYKKNMDYGNFNSYRNLLLSKISDYNNLKSNQFIEYLKMTKDEYDIIQSITEEEFNLIVSAIRERRKPDNSFKDKFKLYNRFITVLSNYFSDNNNKDNLLEAFDGKKICILELQDIDMFQILKEMDVELFIKNVLSDEKVANNLKNVIKNKFIGRLPKIMGQKFEKNYDIDLPGGINNIGLFLTKYRQILERKQLILNSQGKNVELGNINLSFPEIIEGISAVNSSTEEVKRLFGSSEYSDFIANPMPNSNNFERRRREDKIVKIADYLYTLDKVTIPSEDIIIENNDKSLKINFVIGNRTNPSNICHGERTGACMRVGGVGEGLFLKCLTDKNWFHIRIEDPKTHEYISRVSGFRKGNSVFLNQLRYSSNLEKYSNKDLQEFITIYATKLIKDTKGSKYPTENVFINTDYAMEGYNIGSSIEYHLGNKILEGYTLDDVEDLKLRKDNNIWIDVKAKAFLLATTEEGRKNEEGYVPFKGSKDDTCLYDVVRDKIYGIEFDENVLNHHFVIVNKLELIEKINRVNAMKEKLLGKDYRYEINDMLLSFNDIIDGYASSDFYVYIDSYYNIHSDCLEKVMKDGKEVSYGQSIQARKEMNKYIELLRNKYNLIEVKYAL